MVSSTSTTKQELGSFLEWRLVFISPPLSMPNYWNKTHPSTGDINLTCWATEVYSKEPFFLSPASKRTCGQKSPSQLAGRPSWWPGTCSGTGGNGQVSGSKLRVSSYRIWLGGWGGAVHEGQNRVLCTSPSKVNSFSGSVSVTRKTGRFILLVILNGNRKANMDYLIMSEDKFGNEKCQKFFSKMVSLEMF